MKNHRIFFELLRVSGIAEPIPEFKFHPERKWRFDYAWPEFKLSLEVEGGIWTNGRHTRGIGFIGDMEKYNSASTLGWRIIRIQPRELLHTKTMELIKNNLKNG